MGQNSRHDGYGSKAWMEPRLTDYFFKHIGQKLQHLFFWSFKSASHFVRPVLKIILKGFWGTYRYQALVLGCWGFHAWQRFTGYIFRAVSGSFFAKKRQHPPNTDCSRTWKMHSEWCWNSTQVIPLDLTLKARSQEARRSHDHLMGTPWAAATMTIPRCWAFAWDSLGPSVFVQNMGTIGFNLLGGLRNMKFMTFHIYLSIYIYILGMSSSQITNSLHHFSEG